MCMFNLKGLQLGKYSKIQDRIPWSKSVVSARLTGHFNLCHWVIDNWISQKSCNRPHTDRTNTIPPTQRYSNRLLLLDTPECQHVAILIKLNSVHFKILSLSSKKRISQESVWEIFNRKWPGLSLRRQWSRNEFLSFYEIMELSWHSSSILNSSDPQNICKRHSISPSEVIHFQER